MFFSKIEEIVILRKTKFKIKLFLVKINFCLAFLSLLLIEIYM